MVTNKSIWTDFDSELYKRMAEVVKEKLKLSFAEFVRSSCYSLFLELQNAELSEINLQPTSETNLKKIIIKKEGNSHAI